MADRPGEVHYFPDVVTSIVERGRAGGAGRIVVLSGAPGSGRSTVLARVAADLRRARSDVVRWEGRDGALRPVADVGVDLVVEGDRVVGAALQVGGAGAVGDLLALGAEIAPARRKVDGPEAERPPVDPYLAVDRMAKAVEVRAASGPLVLLVDDADRLDPPEVWWDALFATRLARLAAELPLLVVLAVERTSTVASHALRVVDERLVLAGPAEEIRLPALEPERIMAALGPVDDDLLGQLRGLVHGRPAWLDEIWTTWRAEGAVLWEDGRWTGGPDAHDRARTSLHGWVEAALHAGIPDGDGLRRAEEIVATAALEGRQFTVEALADVLGVEDAEQLDELIDWIDEHLADPDGPGLLTEDGFVPRAAAVEPPELRCYRFRSALVAGVLRQQVLARPDGEQRARRYAHALFRAYRHSPFGGIAGTIVRLARAGRDPELEESVRRRANRSAGVEAAARLARFLVDHLDVEVVSPAELAAAVERLNGLTEQLVGRWDAGEVVDLCRGVERAAQRLATVDVDPVGRERFVRLLATAGMTTGAAALRAAEGDEAVAALRTAAELSATTSDHVGTAHAYARLAHAEWLGWGHDTERLESARDHVVTALEHARRGSSRAALMAQVDGLTVSAQLAGTADDRPTRSAAIGASTAILLDVGARYQRIADPGAVFDCVVEAAYLADSDGRPEAAAGFAAAALRCPAESGAVVAELGWLGTLRTRIGDVMGAVVACCQAVRLAQEYYASYVSGEGAELLGLAICTRATHPSFAVTMAVLADPRIDDTPLRRQLDLAFGRDLAGVDDATRQQVEHDYRADRGSRLLRATFGIDVAEIDALNERLGGAGEDEMRGILIGVQRYCARWTSDATP